MRETNFIKQNKEKWQQYELLLDGDSINPDTLSEMYTHITDDLSYARTFYPNRSIRVYLNNLAHRVSIFLDGKKKREKNTFGYFWKEELPKIMWESRRPMLISLVVFSLAVAIGVFSSMVDPEFCSSVLGDSYVEMTKENIDSGDPMKVYKGGSKAGSFIWITVNNIRVAMLSFAMGALAMIGSIIISVYNGIMVGAFQYFFIEKGIYWESILTIWMHGTVEISSIILAGGAGLVMGSGLVFPGTYSRLQAFQLSAWRGAKIILGLVPMFVFAGFIEGFITRVTDLEGFDKYYFDIIRGCFIALNLAFVIFYFIIYPRKVGKRNEEELNYKYLLREPLKDKYSYSETHTNGQILNKSFILFGKYISPLLGYSLLSSIIIAIILLTTTSTFESTRLVFQTKSLFSIINPTSWGNLFSFPIHQLWETSISIMLPIVFLVGTYFISSLTLRVLYNEIDRTNNKKAWIDSILPSFMLTGIIALPYGLTGLLIVLAFPVLTMSFSGKLMGSKNSFNSVGKAFTYTFSDFGKTVQMWFLCLIIFLLINIFTNSELTYFFLEFFNMVLPIEENSTTTIFNFFMTVFNYFGWFTIMIIGIISFTLYGISEQEIKESNGLNEKIKNIGTKRSFRGLSVE